MTLRWVRGEGFEIGAGVRWGDRRHRSLVFAVHLGPGSILGIARFWL